MGRLSLFRQEDAAGSGPSKKIERLAATAERFVRSINRVAERSAREPIGLVQAQGSSSD
jgi:hypothetical protein